MTLVEALCAAIAALTTAVVALGRYVVVLQARWEAEVRHGARLYADGTGEPPRSVPRPEWEESPRWKRVRELIQREVLDEKLKRYLEDSERPSRAGRRDGDR